MIERERKTEERVRRLDAHEVVAWIHELEDRLTEKSIEMLRNERTSYDLGRVQGQRDGSDT